MTYLMTVAEVCEKTSFVERVFAQQQWQWRATVFEFQKTIERSTS